MVVGQAEDPGTSERIGGKRAARVELVEELLEVGDVFRFEANQGEGKRSSRIWLRSGLGVSLAQIRKALKYFFVVLQTCLILLFFFTADLRDSFGPYTP